MPLTCAQQAITFRSWCKEQIATLKNRDCSNERADRQIIGRYWTLEDVANVLSSIIMATDERQVLTLVEYALDMLAKKKIYWLVEGVKKCIPSLLSTWKWTAEGAIAQTHEIIPELWSLLSPEWNATFKKHGKYFQIYHCTNSEVMFDVKPGIEGWCSLSRMSIYQEVALLKVEGLSPLQEAFRLTNHLERRKWQYNCEVLWFEPDMPLRSTSVGDIVVSLASGAVWIVDGTGFRPITEQNSNQKKALRACEVLTECFLGETTDESARIMAFFEKLGIVPEWIGSEDTGSYQLSEKQLALIGRMDLDCVPDLGDWYQEVRE